MRNEGASAQDEARLLVERGQTQRGRRNFFIALPSKATRADVKVRYRENAACVGFVKIALYDAPLCRGTKELLRSTKVT